MNDISVYPFPRYNRPKNLNNTNQSVESNLNPNLKPKQNRSVSVPFSTPREADVAYQVLRVDSEPKRSGVSKILSVEDNRLNVKFTGPEARKVRVGLTSFFESLLLVLETIKEFGPPSAEYSYY